MFDTLHQDSLSLQVLIQHHLKPNWDWLMTVMDSTEAQLRFGSALAAVTDPAHPGHPLYVGARAGRGAASAAGTGNLGSSSHHHHTTERPTFSSSRGTSFAASHATTPADPLANRRDFLTYALSLMRGHHSEHSGAFTWCQSFLS